MRYKPDYRIYIDDINFVNKIGNYNSVNFDIRAIGFENNSPIFREVSSYYNHQLPLPSNKLLSIDEYKLQVKKNIESDIDHLNNLLAALEKEPVYESQINPPEDSKIPISVEAKLGREYFKINEFKAPEWTETDERIKKWLETPSTKRPPKDKEELVIASGMHNVSEYESLQK